MIDLPVDELTKPITDFLQGAGYDSKLVRTDYEVWSGGSVDHFAVAAFGRTVPQDMSTLTILGRAVDGGREHVLDPARDAGAPMAVVTARGRLEGWSLRVDSGPVLVFDVELQQAAQRGQALRDLVGPSSLLTAKATGRQLTLFPVDVALLDRARDRAAAGLAVRATEAMGALIGPRRGPAAYRSATRGVMATLAALMLRDKDRLGATSAHELFRRAKERFPAYFSWWDHEAEAMLDIEAAAKALGDGVNYENLDPIIVSRLYESVLVTPTQRKSQGIYYTPADFSRRLLAALPFEAVGPADRLVYDPTCGSGSLLLAAYDRLDGLLPFSWDGATRHQYLVDHVHGADQDSFAVELARLSLLLRAMPTGDSWDLSERDALSSGPPPAIRPTFVVANPPWKGIRSQDGRRHERATEFLSKMIDLVRPGGYVGAILPASWLTSDVSRASRHEVWRRSDVLEVWRLPARTFPTTPPPPCVVLLQVREPTRRPWLLKNVAAVADLPEFWRTGRSSRASIEPIPDRAGDPYVSSVGDPLLAQLQLLPRLSSVAIVRRGPVRGKDPAIGREGAYLFLAEAKDLPAYGEAPSETLSRVNYPADFHRAGRDAAELLTRRKVLVSAVSTPGAPWRMKAGFDFRGVIPRESMYLVVPRDVDNDDAIFALTAILGSAVANAWIGSREAKRSIDGRTLADLPIPGPNADWARLATAGRLLASSESAVVRRERARDVDLIIESEYGLDDLESAALHDRFRGVIAPEGGTRHEVSKVRPIGYAPPEFRTYGSVLAIEPPTVRLWAAGSTPDDGVEIAPPTGFLGSLAVGDGFDLLGSDHLGDATFVLQRRTYERSLVDPHSADA